MIPGLRMFPPLFVQPIMLTGQGGTLWRSSDGYAWERFVTGSSVALYAAATNGSRTVVVGGGNLVRWSDNLTSWTDVTPPSTGGTRGLRTVVWTGTAFVAAGSFADRIIRSTDGNTWTEHTTGMSASGSLTGSIRLPSGRIVVWGSGGGGDHKSAYSDNDGLTWTTLSTSLGLLAGPGALFGGKLYVSGQPASTTNGGVWSWDLSAGGWTLETNFGEAGAGNGMATNGALLLTHTGSSERIWTSPNGSSWTKQTPGLGLGINAPPFRNDRGFIIGGNLTGPTRARAVVSPAGTSFTTQTIDDLGDAPLGGGV